MDDCALVLNAGSSSLKFGVYARSADHFWNLATRGQIEGIGAAPRISRDGSAASAWVIPTDEELAIARHTGTLLGLAEGRAQRARVVRS